MTQELSVPVCDHGAGIAKQADDHVTFGGSLPFVPVQLFDSKYDLGDLLLGRATGLSVVSAQHLARAGSLLFCQSCVVWDRSAGDRGEKAGDGLQPIQTADIQWDDGD